MGDIFGSLNLEETHLKEGCDEGYKDGLIAGKDESKQVGLKVGFEVGEELGFYRGCFDVWNSTIRVDSDCLSLRVKIAIKQMDGLIEKYPVLDPENLQEIIYSLRHEFKTVYISESRNRSALESIERAAKFFPRAPIINKFEDVAYNRVGYTLVSELAPVPSSEPCHLRSAVSAMVKAAFDNIDFKMHCGTHPTLGIVDHICCHPLADASLDQAAGCARLLASDVGTNLQVPVFLYGAAYEEWRPLDSIRRALEYFKPNSSANQWVGGPRSNFLTLNPDNGPSQVSPSKGVVVIGATKWVDNYNIPLLTSNINAVRRIARGVSGRGGGLPTVQAMALEHGEGVIEVACNLLDPSRVGGDRVQHEVESLAGEEGISVGKGYFTDLSEEEVMQSYLKLGPSY